MANQLDLFEWANNRVTATVLDWNEPFAQRVLARINEYDDDRPKARHVDTVVALRPALAR
ncbi:hypothetical protein ASD50_01315 [Mesorhizobium sp. Root552]|jgi:hypothetical protein|nr:hypothetical protein ASD50_01315 [Mesorhizobium sp. Root552]